MLNVQHLIPRLSPRALARHDAASGRGRCPALWSFRHYLRIAPPAFALPAPPAAVAPVARRGVARGIGARVRRIAGRCGYAAVSTNAT